MNRLDELALKLLDGSVSEDEIQELETLSRSDEGREALARLIEVESHLLDIGRSSVEDNVVEQIEKQRASRVEEGVMRAVEGAARSASSKTSRFNRFHYAAGILALGALVTCWMLIGPLFDKPADPLENTFVTVVQTVDVNWDGGPRFSTGDRLASGTLQLAAGIVHLMIDNGVEVTLEGPAELELMSPGKTRLKTGLLTATVPEGAKGFRVDTPSAQVVDLGTSFGIDLRQDGYSHVSVFDGEVEVALPDESNKKLLTEGKSVRVSTEQEIEEIAFDPQPFEKVWPISSGIASSTEVFRFVPPWPRRLRFVESNKDIFVAVEGFAVELSQPLMVNISQPSSCVSFDDLTPSELPIGQHVRSYILHYSPYRNVGPRRARRISGSITFDRPILGLIVRQRELLASSQRFTRRRAGETLPHRGLEFNRRVDRDRITLSDNRRTVTVDLISPGRSSDLIRVICDADFEPDQ